MAINRPLRPCLSILLLLAATGPVGAQGFSRPLETDGTAPGLAIKAPPSAAPVILEGRLVAKESSSGLAGWLLEVERVVQGSVPGSTLLVTGEGLSERQRPQIDSGTLQVVVQPRDDGSFRMLSWGPAAAPAPRSATEAELRSLIAGSTASPTFEERVVELVNQERLANGTLPPLKYEAMLTQAAEFHSQAMGERDFFAHCDPDTGTLPWDRMVAAGYFWSGAAENIAAGSSSPEAVMSQWMGSAGHRANILSTGLREIGVGYFLQSNDQRTVRHDLNSDCAVDSLNNGPYFRYWTQKFGQRFNVYPVVIDREAHSTNSRTVELYLYGEGWASQMRMRNAGEAWGSWRSFNSETAWTLPSGAGTKTVEVEIRNAFGTVRSARDTIFLNLPCEVVANLNLDAQTVTGTQTFEACDTISADNGFEVGSTGTVTFRAGNRVVLGHGFSVASGGSFTVETGIF